MRDSSILQVYSDESGFPSERFQSLSVVSGRENDIELFRDKLKQVLEDENISELKWAKLNGHSPKMRAAQRFIKIVLGNASQGKIRIDTLYWDIGDSRHKVIGRDDLKNIGIMYYKVIKHAIRSWNLREVKWEWYPDEHSGINWNEVSYFLNNTKLGKKNLGISSLFDDWDETYYINIMKLHQVNSKEEPMIQVADLFAGLARFSKEKGGEYFKWLESEESKKYPRLFMIDEEKEIKSSIKTKARFSLLRRLDQRCKKYKMQVSLKTNKCLTTKKPTNPINFWFYTPQIPEDKAPRR